MHQEQRADPREPLALPITLGDGTQAVTRDIGPEGLYFLMPAGKTIDDWVALAFEMPRARLKFTAAGEVVRIDRHEHCTGVALRLHGARLVPLD